MYNEELHKLAEKMYDRINNAPPISFNFNNTGGKEPRTEKISFRLPKLYYDMLDTLAKDNRASVSDILNEILFAFWIDYKNAVEDLQKQKTAWLKNFDSLSKEKQEAILNDSVIIAKSEVSQNISEKYKRYEREALSE